MSVREAGKKNKKYPKALPVFDVESQEEVDGLRCSECGRLQQWSHAHDITEELTIEHAFQLVPRLEAVIAEVRKQAVLTGPKPTDDQVQEALKEAVAGIYFYGAKDFSRHTCEAYLWKVVKALNPRLFELLLQDKQAAYNMAHCGQPTCPEDEGSDSR